MTKTTGIELPKLKPWKVDRKLYKEAPKVGYHPEAPFDQKLINPEFITWEQVVLFLFFWGLYFLIEMTESESNFNMVEGCYQQWYSQIL